jgi:hypothetical protein
VAGIYTPGTALAEIVAEVERACAAP